MSWVKGFIVFFLTVFRFHWRTKYVVIRKKRFFYGFYRRNRSSLVKSKQSAWYKNTKNYVYTKKLHLQCSTMEISNEETSSTMLYNGDQQRRICLRLHGFLFFFITFKIYKYNKFKELITECKLKNNKELHAWNKKELDKEKTYYYKCLVTTFWDNFRIFI